jgi:hypothetical protein
VQLQQLALLTVRQQTHKHAFTLDREHKSYFPAQKSSAGSTISLARKKEKLHGRTSVVYSSNKGIEAGSRTQQ